MITEQDALWALPPTGWLRDYVAHAVKQTTAPLGYHLATGLSVLAVSSPPNLLHRYAGDLHSNLYTLLIGRSGEDQKSTALKKGLRILRASDTGLIGRDPGSPEGLIVEMGKQPRMILPYSEFGTFLAKAGRKGGYFEPTKALLTDLWDCTPQDRAKADGKGTPVPEPRLSIVAACSLPYLEKHTEAADWSGGFMGRWAVIYAKRERTDPDPKGDDSAVAGLALAIKERAETYAAGPCLGLNNAARQLWFDWYYDLEARYVPALIAGAKTRAPTIARKVAMLNAWDWDFAKVSKPGGWYIDEHHLGWAIRFAELHLKSVIGLAEKLAEHPDARLRRNLLDMIDVGKALSLGNILRRSQHRARNVREILEGLVIDGSLRAHIVAGTAGDVLYERLR